LIRPIRIAAAIALLCAATGCATTYGGSNGGGLFGGQKATRLDANSWEIYSGANGYSAPEFAQNSALYKAALVARAGGFPYFQIYRFDIYINKYGQPGQDAKLRMHPVTSPYPRFVCESARFAENCRTLNTDATIALTESLIHRTPEQTAAEVASTRKEFGLSPLTDEQLLAESERASAATRLQQEAAADVHREADASAQLTRARKGDTRAAATEKKARWEATGSTKLSATHAKAS
jgi:hypothetical protein